MARRSLLDTPAAPGRTESTAAASRRPLRRGATDRAPITAPVLLLAFALASAPVAGCASWSTAFDHRADGTLVHRKRGYRIGVPPEHAGAGWKRESVEGAVLSFRYAGPEPDGGRTTLSLLTECRRIAPAAQLQARNLRLGLGPTTTTYAGPAVHLGHPAWSQAFEARVDGRPVFVEAVTVVVGYCTYDFVLVSPRDPRELDGVFRAWWTGFSPAPDDGQVTQAGVRTEDQTGDQPEGDPAGAGGARR